MTPYQAACKRNRAYTWERLRYIFEPTACIVVPKRTNPNPIEQFPPRAPHGGGRPLIPGSRSESQRKYRERCAKKPCSVDGCPRGCHSGGMCAAHNRRQRRGTLEVGE